MHKKISPVCQRELWRGLALPCEDIFLYGGSSSRSGDEFISRPPAGDLDGLLLVDEDKLGQHFHPSSETRLFRARREMI